MCNPLQLLQCCCPQQRIGTMALQQGIITPAEAQGLDDFCKNLLSQLGCRERADSGKATLKGVIYAGTLRAAKQSFPQADPNCLAPAIEGIIDAVGQACVEFPNGDAAFLNKLLVGAAPHVGKLLQCVFGAERAREIELGMYRTAAQFMLCRPPQPAPNPPQNACLTMLLPILLPILLGMCGIQQPTQPGGGGCCPPPGGGGGGTSDVPPHEPIVHRGGVDAVSVEGSM